MSNHPNRNPNSETACPRPSQVRAARLAAGLTPQEAGALVHESARRWQRFEATQAPEAIRMHPATWELFTIKVELRGGRNVPAPVGGVEQSGAFVGLEGDAR